MHKLLYASIYIDLYKVIIENIIHICQFLLDNTQ
jgi:hypothetical protein